MAETPYRILKTANRLPTPPGVAIRILELVENDETSLDDLSQVVSSDPALTSKVLKFINSPLIGLGFHGSTVQEAVARIGMRGAQMMALSFSLVSEKHRESCPSFNFDRFWSESLARAVAARTLAGHLAGWDPEEAFITGLLCRMGKLVLSTGMPEEYEPILSARVYPELALEARERAVLGSDHLEVGMHLLKDWHVPEIVWRTAGRLGATDPAERDTRSARIIEMADVIAKFMVEEDEHTAPAVRALAARAEERLEVDGERFRDLLGKIGQDWINYGRLLSVPTQRPPDLAAIESQAEEHRTSLRLASEVEVRSLRSENEHLSRRARRDGLTGMLNRAAFDEALPAALEAARNGKPCALLLLDIDHFKQVNDTHGHPVGDAVLVHLARLVDDNVRKRDQVFRYGGEEFAVIAHDCGREAAEALAETLRAAVEATPHVDGDLTIPLTISLGVAWADWPGRPAEPAELIEYADQRLYEAKHGGRNAWRSRPAGKPGGLLARIKRFLPGGSK